MTQYYTSPIPYEKPTTLSQLQAENERLRELVSELIPYSGDSCPEECRYREECNSESNLDSHGWAMTCVAYTHLVEKARELGVEVDDAG